MTWELNDDRPIYVQIIEQVKLRIVAGLYPLGGKLPSVRDMAAEAAVNPNTMQRALSDLERDGLLYSERTSGRFVTEDGEKVSGIKETLAREVISDFMAKMNRIGFSHEQTVSAVSKYNKG